MTKLSEFLTELSARISAAGVSGFWTDTQKTSWLNQAGERVCNYHYWKELEDALKTITKANQDYYDMPETLQEGSIYMLTVDGEEHKKKSWAEYQQYKTAESTDKIFAMHDGYYFVSPTPEEADLEIDIWGIKKWVKLVDAADESTLSSKFDEAIIKLALAICLKKEGEYNEANSEIAEVENPANPTVENSGGILARLIEQEDKGGKDGYIGQAKSSRWD